MIYPKFLGKGNCIGVPAPSDGAYNDENIEKFKNAKSKFESFGYNIVLSKNIFNSEMGRSASANIRAEEINEMCLNKDINAIICAAGGEFFTECLSYINFKEIAKCPKWIQGFSDATAILFVLTTKYDIASIYAHNFKRFAMEEYHYSLKNNLEILKGNNIKQNSFELYESWENNEVENKKGYSLNEKVKWQIINNQYCKIKGRMIGGCIENISVLSGTNYDGTIEFCEKYKDDGIIWYFDNYDISREELIRVLWKFNELGYFKYAKGILFGRPAFNNSCLGYTMENALKDSVITKLDIPVIYDTCISHQSPTLTIINGAMANLKVKDNKAILNFELI